MTYVKIADTAHGELGHNGWTWVLNHPYSAEDRDHPAYYEETGVLTVAPSIGHTDELLAPQVEFRRIFATASRGGIVRNAEIHIPITIEQAHAGKANRAAYDAIHRPVGGYKVIVD
jgi:hypothetical protein